MGQGLLSLFCPLSEDSPVWLFVAWHVFLVLRCFGIWFLVQCTLAYSGNGKCFLPFRCWDAVDQGLFRFHFLIFSCPCNFIYFRHAVFKEANFQGQTDISPTFPSPNGPNEHQVPRYPRVNSPSSPNSRQFPPRRYKQTTWFSEDGGW